MHLAPAAVAVLAAALASPPSGRPPMGPLQREKPRVYDVKYEVTLNTAVPHLADDPRNPRSPELSDPRGLEFGGTFDIADTPIVMPLVYQGTYHRVHPKSIGAELWLGSFNDPGIEQRARVDDGFPHHGHLVVLPIERFRGQVLRWSVSYRLHVYASKVDDRAAAGIPWPREWPAEVADGLTPQMYIESDHEFYRNLVQHVGKGQLRLAPPYLVAKDLVRYCCNEVQVSGSGDHRGRSNVLHGMRVQGALATGRSGRGGPHDLVCVCIALLRAAKIPARPVVGIREDERGRKSFVSWGEFYLPNAGWIPFDPNAMRGNGVRNRDVRQPWPEFGTMDDLHDWIPLAYHFIPPKLVESPQSPAVWGWDPRPNGAPPAEQRINVSIVSRGAARPELLE